MTQSAIARAGLAAVVVGAAARLCFFLLEDGMYYPDEVFQYLEPAHARITGSGWLAWEYEVGARNWALPAFWGGIMEIARGLGLRGQELHRALMLVSALLGALIVPAGLRLGRALTGDARAGVVLALLFACFPLLGFFAPRTISENPALIFTVWAYALYFELDTPGLRAQARRARWVGLLLGAAVVCRTTSLVFVPALLAHLFLLRRERLLLHCLAGLGLAVLALAVLDWLTWGRPLQSVFEFVRANRMFERDLGERGLGEPPTFYLAVLVQRIGVVGIALALLMLPFAGRRGVPLTVFWLVPLVVLGALHHKQERFVLGLLPLFFANALLGAHRLGRAWSPSSVRFAAAPAAFALCLCVSALPGASAMPFREHAGAFQALSWIGTQRDASGVLVDRGENANGGYLLLERCIPLAPFEPVLAGNRVFNYVIVETAALRRTLRARGDFRERRAFEGAVVFRREVSVTGPPGDSTRDVCGDATVTTCSLLREMWSLDSLTRAPDPPFEAHQASSRSPASTTPDEPDWFSNHDAGNYLRIDESTGRREHVMMEADGPGAVVRIWSANPGGTLRIYVDGSAVPSLEVDMSALLRGGVPPFVHPYGHLTAGGHNLYWPLVFASSMRITTDAPDLYYHVQWRAYRRGTDVESSSAELLRTLTALGSVPPPLVSGDSTGESHRLHVEPGGAGTVAISTTSPEAIRSIEITPDVVSESILRETELALSFDGVETARVPLGDFFGSGPGLNPYQSYVAAVRPDGSMRARWHMPFRRAASIVLRNTGAQPLDFEARIERSTYAWDGRSMYFHAAWRSTGPIDTVPPRDWTLLTVSGRGRYVGTLLNVANPVEAWWGEGDEKIRIDDDVAVRFFGTGTEDYFGYAWRSSDLYAHPFHSQTRADGPANAGRSSNNRWHLIDSIPFATSFRFDLEILTWSDTTVVFDALAYWYADLPRPPVDAEP